MTEARQKGELAPLAIRYAVVGVINTVVHFAITAVLVESGLLAPVPASVVGFAFAVLVSFILNRHWTFGITDKPLERLVKFMIVSLFGLFLNTVIMYLAVEILHLHYLAGLLMVLFVVPPSNFLLNLFWSFGPGEQG